MSNKLIFFWPKLAGIVRASEIRQGVLFWGVTVIYLMKTHVNRKEVKASFV